MDVLCFDISSAGVTGARFDERLEATALREIAWELHRDTQGDATLPAEAIAMAVERLARELHSESGIAAVSIGCFMHSFLVMSSCCAPLTPVFTWMDAADSDGVDAIRKSIGSGFHELTGCHYHPMFPVFKLASHPAGRGNRVGSPKAYLAQELTGSFVDDVGTANASGLLDVRSGRWSKEILMVVGLDEFDLPKLIDPHEIAGTITDAASARFGVPAGIPVVAGSGDGFLANTGSGCDTSRRIAITLGTSAAARQKLAAPVLSAVAGTFCYRADSQMFLLGCASSNGGNALDWSRTLFGTAELSEEEQRNPPIFMPWLRGERSLEWNPGLRASWRDVTSKHTGRDLQRAVAEGVLFNVAQYVETIERESGISAEQAVLSGNGFREPSLAELAGALIAKDVLLPSGAGLATLRGAAICAWRALGHDASPAVDRLVSEAECIRPKTDPALLDRFARFKEYRRMLS